MVEIQILGVPAMPCWPKATASLTSPPYSASSDNNPAAVATAGSEPCCCASSSHRFAQASRASAAWSANSSTDSVSGSAAALADISSRQRRERLAGVPDRAVPVLAGRGKLDRQVGVQLGNEDLAARGPRLDPLQQRPGGGAGADVHAGGVQQRRLQRFPGIARHRPQPPRWPAGPPRPRTARPAPAPRSAPARPRRAAASPRCQPAPRPGGRQRRRAPGMVSSWPRSNRTSARTGGWRGFGQRPLQAQHGDVGCAAAAGIGRGLAQLGARPTRPRPGPRPAGARSPPAAAHPRRRASARPAGASAAAPATPGPGRPPSAPAGGRTAGPARPR